MGYDGSIRINTEISTKSVQVQLAALENRMVKTTDKITSLRAKMDSLKDAKIPTQEYQNLQKELDKSTQELEKMVAQDSKLADIDSKIKSLSQSSAEYAAKMKEVAAQKIPAYEYSEMQKELAKAEKNADSLYGKLRVMEQTGDTASKGYERLKQQIKNADQLVSELRNGMLELEQSGKAFTLGTDTEQYRNLSSKYEQVNAELEKQKGIHSEIAQKQADAVQKTIELKSQMNQLVEEGRAFTLGAETEEYAKLGQQLKYAENDIAVLNKRHDDLIAKQRKTSNGYKKLGDVAKKAFTTVGNMIKKANSFVVSFVKRIKEVAQKHLPFFRKETEKTKSSLSGFGAKLKNLALSLLIFNQISKIIKGATSGIKEGFENLYNENEKFKNSIESVKASLLTLKNALAGAFAPIVEIAIPYIQKLIGWLTEAVNLIGQFIAALTGRKTYTKAIKQTADAFKEAEKAAKGYLSPLDEINKYSDGESEEENESQYGLMFEELPIEQKFKDMAEKVKDVFSDLFEPIKEAWNREGEFVIDSWKYGLDEIWKLIKDIGRDFLAVWQQEATIKIFEDILHIIGDIGLVVGNLSRNFREAWNENEVGLHILEKIRDILGIIVGHVRNAADATVEWSDKLDFYPLLDAFDRFLESLKPAVDAISGTLEDFYTKVILPLGTWTIEKGLPELLQVFIDFNEKVDWESLRANLAEFWEHMEPFAETVGEGLIIFIGRLSDALANFINSPEFSGFLTKVEEWMDKVTPEDVADGFQKIAIAIVALKVASAAFTGISAAFTTFSGVASVLKGVLSLLSPVISAIGGAIGGLIVPIGIVVAAVAALAAGFIYAYNTSEEFRNKVSELKDKFIEFWDGSLKPMLEEWGEKFRELWEEHIKPALTGIMEALKMIWEDALIPLAGWIVDTLLPVLLPIIDEIFNTSMDLIGELFDEIKDLADIISNCVSLVVDLLRGDWSSAWEHAGNIVETIWNGITRIIKGAVEKLTGWIEGLLSLFDKANNKGSSIGSGESSQSYSASSYSMRSISSPYAANPVFAALSSTPIPRLATGAVIPANREFLAVLGDQKHGTNVEAPLDTIKQATEESVLNVLSRLGIGGNLGNSNPQTIIVKQYLDGKQVYETVIKEGKIRQMSTGGNDFMLGTT